MAQSDQPTGHLNQPVLGISLVVFGMFAITVQDALVKWLTASFPVLQILLVRSVVMLVPVMLVLAIRQGSAGFKTRRPLAHLLRIVLNIIAFVLFFFALARLPLADAFVITMTAPLFMALLSGPLLGEYPRRQTWLAVLIGFSGVIVLFDPLATAENHSRDIIGMTMALVASIFYSLWMIQTRYLSTTERSGTLVFYGAIGAAVIAAIGAPFVWQADAPATQWLLLAGVGLVSAVAHSLIVQAYRYAPVYVLGPFDYTCLVWGVLFGYWIWGDLPTVNVWIGAALIISCGLYLYLLNRTPKNNTD